MKHSLSNNKKHTTVKGNNMAMAKKKSPKNLPKPTSMGSGGGAGRGAGAAGKSIPKRKATGIKDAKGLEKMKKALKNQTPPKRNTPASQPSTKLMQNIGRQSALRKKFPEKFNPGSVKKK